MLFDFLFCMFVRLSICQHINILMMKWRRKNWMKKIKMQFAERDEKFSEVASSSNLISTQFFTQQRKIIHLQLFVSEVHGDFCKQMMMVLMDKLSTAVYSKWWKEIFQKILHNKKEFFNYAKGLNLFLLSTLYHKL